MKVCRPEVTLSLTALPCFAASMSGGIGKRLSKCTELPRAR